MRVLNGSSATDPVPSDPCAVSSGQAALHTSPGLSFVLTMRTTFLCSIALSVALLFHPSTDAFAQQAPEWTNAASTQGRIGIDVAINADQESYVTGQYQGQIMVRKVAADGSTLWEVTSPVNEDLRSEVPTNVFVDPDGDVVVVGYRYYLWTEWGREILMLTVLKYAPDGSLIYKHLWPGHYSSFNNQRYRNGVLARMDEWGYVYIGTGGHMDGHPAGFNVIKVSPAGNIVWLSTESFTGDFFMAYDLRLLGDKLGLAGATSYLDGNSTTWALDTTGTTIWTNVSDGEGARGIVLAADGSAHVLTWRDVDLVGDVVVYQVNASGTLVWDHSYDQGRHESALAMEPSPDGAVLVMAKGNTPSNIYTDWLTLKVSATGDLLWTQRHNEQTHNYETPYRMKVDAEGNCYVTGNGGPMPGGFDLSRLQLVTVKYDAAGTMLWTARVDTLTTTNYGVGLAPDGQGGVYVLGREFSLLMHFTNGISTLLAPRKSTMDITIFPNPAADMIHVGLSAHEGIGTIIRLLTSDGRELVHKRATSRSEPIDLTGLPAGLYVCEVVTGKERTRAPFVIR